MSILRSEKGPYLCLKGNKQKEINQINKPSSIRNSPSCTIIWSEKYEFPFWIINFTRASHSHSLGHKASIKVSSAQGLWPSGNNGKIIFTGLQTALILQHYQLEWSLRSTVIPRQRNIAPLKPKSTRRHSTPQGLLLHWCMAEGLLQKCSRMQKVKYCCYCQRMYMVPSKRGSHTFS